MAQGESSGKAIEELEKSAYFGDREFRQRIQEMLDRKEIRDEIPLRYRRPTEIGIDQIRKAVAGEWRVSEEALARRRGGDEEKAAIYLARKFTRLGGREVGAAFGVKAARVSHIIGLIESDPASRLARRIAQLRNRLLYST